MHDTACVLHRALELHEIVVEATEGASPAYIKELLRRAALIATIETGVARVRDAHLKQAMDELSGGGELAKRIVGFGTSAYLPPAPSVGPMRPAGFPHAQATRVVAEAKKS